MDSAFRGYLEKHTEVLPIDGVAESTAGKRRGADLAMRSVCEVVEILFIKIKPTNLREVKTAHTNPP